MHVKFSVWNDTYCTLEFLSQSVLTRRAFGFIWPIVAQWAWLRTGVVNSVKQETGGVYKYQCLLCCLMNSCRASAACSLHCFRGADLQSAHATGWSALLDLYLCGF